MYALLRPGAAVIVLGQMKHIAFALIVCVGGLAGCVYEEDELGGSYQLDEEALAEQEPEIAAEITANSVAASAGSCEGSCGERSADGCWCDTKCEQFGDCCDDRANVCEGEAEAEGADASESEPALASGDVPETDHCASVSAWQPAWIEFESRVLELVNDARASGGSCGEEGEFVPAEPVTMNPNLRCAARLHATDMADNEYFAHDSQDGSDPFDRIRNTGYEYAYAGENIAAGQMTPEEVVQALLDSPAHCVNILASEYTEIGVGYAGGGPYGHYWAQSFGAP